MLWKWVTAAAAAAITAAVDAASSDMVYDGLVAMTFGACVMMRPNLKTSRRTNIWLSFSQADLGPRSAQELFISGFLKSLKRLFLKICAHSELYRNILACVFEILTFYGNIAFPLSPV